MTRARSVAIGLLLVLAALGSAACKDGGGVETGLLTASLATPNSDDGAVLVSIQGSGLADVKAASSGYQVYWRLVSPTELRVVVIGNVAAGPLFTAQAPAAADAAAYAATVHQVASRDNAERASIEAYRLDLQVHQ